MKVKDAMMGTAYYCQLDTNLGSATELMWVGNCGFLPVMGPNGKIAGVITDRDICMALGTRNRLPGDITVGDVMSGRLFACSPDDDVHIALQLMQEGGVRRLPVIGGNGTLVGVVSIDDLVLRAETPGIGQTTGTFYRRSRENLPSHRSAPSASGRAGQRSRLS